MKKEEKKASKEAKTIKVADAVSAYNLLNQQKREEKTNDIKGVKISALDTTDIFKVLYAVKALKPIVTAYEDFRKDVDKQFQPENWTERVGKYNEASDEEKETLNKEYVEYQQKVNDCVRAELDKEKEIESYERLDKEAFGILIKTNDILDVPQIMLLSEILV